MIRSLSYGSFLLRLGLRSSLTLMVFMVAGSYTHFHAQAPVPVQVGAGDPSSTAELPAAPSPAVPALNSSAAPVIPSMKSRAIPSAFGQIKMQLPVQGRGANANNAPWKSATLDSFQPGAAPLTLGDGMRPGGPSRPTTGGFNRGTALNGRSGDPGSLFQLGGNPTSNLSNGTNRLAGGTPATFPSLNELMRSNLSLPLTSSFGSFHLSYRDMLGPGGNAMGGELGRGSASALFSTVNRGSGMSFSAGTFFGNSSTAGSRTGGIGGSSISGRSFGAEKHSGPTATVKLSF